MERKLSGMAGRNPVTSNSGNGGGVGGAGGSGSGGMGGGKPNGVTNSGSAGAGAGAGAGGAVHGSSALINEQMEGIGLSIGETNKRNLAQRRMKKGECPTCGNKTHKVSFFGKRTALTREGICLHGRCLLCNPVEGYIRRILTTEGTEGVGGMAATPGIPGPKVGAAAPMPEGSHVVPRMLNFVSKDHEIPDDSTMVSGITLDHRLIMAERHWNGEVRIDELYEDETVFQPGDNTPFVRPEPSLAGDMEFVQPKRGSAKSFKPPPQLSQHHTEYQQQQQQFHHLRQQQQQQQQQQQMYSQTSQSQLDSRTSRPIQRGSFVKRNQKMSPSRMPPPTHLQQQQSNYRDIPLQHPRGGGGGGGGGSWDRNEHKIDDIEEFVIHQGGLQDYIPKDGSFRVPSSGHRRRIGEDEDIPAHRSPVSQVEYPAVAVNTIVSNNNMSGNNNNNNNSNGHSSKSDGFNQFDRDLMATSTRNHHRAVIQQPARHSSSRSPEPKDVPREFQTPPIREYQSAGAVPREFHESPAVPAQATQDFNQPGLGHEFRPVHELPDVVPRQSMRSTKSKEGSIWAANSQHHNNNHHHNISNGDSFAPRSLHLTQQPPLLHGRGQPDDEIVALSRPIGRKPVAKPNIQQVSKVVDGEKPGIQDIPNVINNVASDKEGAFRCLGEIVLSNGQPAKEMIRDHSGITTLVETMWTDMSEEPVQEAACELLFALVASVDGNSKSDVLVGPDAEGAVDALLIIMQTHLQEERIQIAGCGTLCCLAAASKANREINDGTLSGAILSVVSAMSMHRKNSEVQEWGIRALHAQCMLSVNAEANRKSLAESEGDGEGGVNVIWRAMEAAGDDLVTVELSCRLYWCLSANDDICRILTRTPKPVEQIIAAVSSVHKRPEGTALIEAGYGALANLARLSQTNHSVYRERNIISKAVDSLQAFRYDEEMYVEACGLLAVLASNPENKQEIMEKEAVGIMARLVTHFSHNPILQEEALNALLLLCIDSDSTKTALSTDSTIGALVKMLRDQNASQTLLEICCSIICSLSIRPQSAEVLVSHGAVDGLLSVLNAFPQERKLQDAAMGALRNLSGSPGCIDKLTSTDTIQLLLNGMKNSLENESVQISTCCIIWSIYTHATRVPSSLIDAGGGAHIVRAMQSHMESGKLLEMACGALWSMAGKFDDMEKDLVTTGAIDAVTCALVMHPNTTSTLETACGLLASVCTKDDLADAIKEYQGISMVVEAMRNNTESLKLLEIGCLLLRNLVLMNEDNASEASGAISTIVNAMKDNPDAVGLQREACHALWALASQSEDCKSKIVAMDGITILINAMEHNGNVRDIQNAARGAWLALAGT